MYFGLGNEEARLDESVECEVHYYYCTPFWVDFALDSLPKSIGDNCETYVDSSLYYGQWKAQEGCLVTQDVNMRVKVVMQL